MLGNSLPCPAVPLHNRSILKDLTELKFLKFDILCLARDPSTCKLEFCVGVTSPQSKYGHKLEGRRSHEMLECKEEVSSTLQEVLCKEAAIRQVPLP